MSDKSEQGSGIMFYGCSEQMVHETISGESVSLYTLIRLSNHSALPAAAFALEGRKPFSATCL